MVSAEEVMLIRKGEHVLSAEEVYVNKKGGKQMWSAEGFMLIRKEGNMCCLLKRFMLIRKEEHVLSAEDVFINKKGGTCVVC